MARRQKKTSFRGEASNILLEFARNINNKKNPKIKRTPKSLLEKHWQRLINKSKKGNYEFFLKSEYWLKVRRMVLKRDENKCTKCGQKQNLHVHHDTYKNHFNEHNNLNDLRVLCENCHKEFHEKNKVII